MTTSLPFFLGLSGLAIITLLELRDWVRTHRSRRRIETERRARRQAMRAKLEGGLK